MTTTSATNPTVELVDSSPLLGDPAALRERADEHGYLFFRGLLDRDRVLGLRRQMMDVIGSYGWLADGTDPMDGIADVAAFEKVPPAEAGFCGTGVPLAAYQDINRLQEFHSIGHDPALLDLYAGLLGGTVIRHPMSIARIMIPSAQMPPTPAHQDFIHIQGSKNVWTAWFPLGDCPVELGGLSVLVGSQADGLLTYHAAAGPGELEAYICSSGYPWAVTDFRAGDVLTFSSLTVHRGTRNVDGERVRLSLDLRYQRVDEPMTPGNLTTHCKVLPWEDVYRDWKGDELQYYWREHELLMTEWSEELRWQKHKIC
ncbi:Phytanoyl-CoA dioxygenase [Beutenbergia cavernae DSM 12333]|uniref:Phytanoyl-CoA dioxygenase n=1 Tax=Beutenbergia cavernae (strain ATCC BAA-8 / DSM 12333 / CCUG 43141 / JCM 11478 / NBRC 16432 / NCIMB 13614 / HKI 0122) TaxID=471853 RepID=C5BZM4_BEUC1|nr:phytanoyl-CoA dioxygenase family protein [Beutenbergia cavernae]ACQ79196.1 Phytanoyl-CoA dioxygenase [Beutenbergia cavernae DSM 12333]